MPKYCLMSSSFSTFIVVILLQLINTNSCLKFWKSPLICLFSFTHTISNPFSTWWLGILYHKHTWSHNSSALNSSLVFFTHKLKYKRLITARSARMDWALHSHITTPSRLLSKLQPPWLSFTSSNVPIPLFPPQSFIPFCVFDPGPLLPLTSDIFACFRSYFKHYFLYRDPPQSPLHPTKIEP